MPESFALSSFRYASCRSQIHSYSEEAGLRSHSAVGDIKSALYGFLFNAPADVSTDLAHFPYIFFLDKEPVERELKASSYQLVHSDVQDNLSFERWAETFVQSMCLANRFNGIPAFDQYDLASVLRNVRQQRLLFYALPVDPPTFSTVLAECQDLRFNRLLAVLFSPAGSCLLAEALPFLEACRGLGRDVVTGGAFPPCGKDLLILLGDPASSLD